MLKRKHFIEVNKRLLVTIVCLVLIVPAVFFFYNNWFEASACESEKKAVLNAARKFLDAEVRKDYPAVYACFASSSPYARSHSYDEYLAEATVSADHVADYRIVNVSYIQENDDLKTYPAVEKFAQVEVEVTFLHDETKLRSELNIGFIFLKERGRWYKS